MSKLNVMGGFIETNNNIVTVYDHIVNGSEVHVAVIDTIANTIDIVEYNLDDSDERAAFDEQFGFEYCSIFDIGFKKNGTLELFDIPNKTVLFATTFVNLVTECQERLAA